MPFDMTPDRRPERDGMDWRHRLAVSVQNSLGRPMTLDEYKQTWNTATEAIDPSGEREDYLL